MTARCGWRSRNELTHEAYRTEDPDLDNSGNGPLRVPGFGYDVLMQCKVNDRFSHGFLDWAQTQLTAREIAMLHQMNKITDEPCWEVNINNPVIVARWAADALTAPLISPRTWDWCMAELRDKAAVFASTGLVHVLNAASRVCKSDALISPELLSSLEVEVDDLARQQDAASAYNFGNKNAARPSTAQRPGLVDPDLHPLVYGTSRVLSHGGRVGMEDVALASGQGIVEDPHWQSFRNGSGSHTAQPAREPRAFRFSPNFQWLPCEVSFLPEAPPGNTKVVVSSYINNLHPVWHQSLYKIIEQYISASIEPWNAVLVRRDQGRDPQRIITYGVQWKSDFPERAAALASRQRKIIQPHKDACAEARAVRDITSIPLAPLLKPRSSMACNCLSRDDRIGSNRVVRMKSARARPWLHPEPGESFTYEDWKAGKNNFPVVNGMQLVGNEYHSLPPKENHNFYGISLQDMFGDKGLQVIVEIGGIELTPEEPTRYVKLQRPVFIVAFQTNAFSDAADWQLSGLLNEHIVATTMVYFSSSNVTPESGALSFRVEADLDAMAHVHGSSLSMPFRRMYEPLADIYGVVPIEDLQEGSFRLISGRSVQELGTVSTPDGRSVTFPNVMQHRIGACSLADPSKPGHRRFLRLHLVDPHYRICSTRNVPPQQNSWWADAGWWQIDWKARGLPAELLDMIADHIGDECPMGQTEAERLRLLLLEERAVRQQRTMEDIERYVFGQW
ncbi:hypothetical protein CMQ_5175 [Grosmannia clavigera kw1407]|uniref:Duf1665 domain containing protein n=1 Tax=Grosmannia clavigera (strain kw1407 / UAMH 11150) TaxID=655863 RepID=F0XBJ0_GROCL|nr:uncharacterized protein CMQ_5175 [Grosmannia clavigera kw1407]EFX04913.1 hypothetical protein CMQ_5175 [Grosmannia clavigera kw1407]